MCNIELHMNRNFNYACPVHDEYKLDYATGKLIPVEVQKAQKEGYNGA